jgi:hypothetical protein
MCNGTVTIIDILKHGVIMSDVCASNSNGHLTRPISSVISHKVDETLDIFYSFDNDKAGLPICTLKCENYKICSQHE